MMERVLKGIMVVSLSGAAVLTVDAANSLTTDAADLEVVLRYLVNGGFPIYCCLSLSRQNKKLSTAFSKLSRTITDLRIVIAELLNQQYEGR